MKNFKKPLLLLVLILVFGGIAYWDEWKTKKDEQIAKEKDRLIDLKASAVSEIHYIKVAKEGPGVDVKIVKNEGRWQLTGAKAYPADAETIDRWLKTLEELSFEKSFEASPDKLKDFGLSPAQITIGLKSVEGQEVKLLIGAKSPVGYSSYVQIEGRPNLYLVSHYLFTASNKELSDLRDKSLAMPPLASIEHVSFQRRSDPPIQIKREGEVWMIEAPQAGKADAQEVMGFLAFFERQKLDRFIDEPSPELSKALSADNLGTSRVARLELDVAGGQKVSYDFIENNDVIYTKVAQTNAFVALDKKIAEGLDKTLRDFQSRGMFSFNSTEIKKVEIDGKVFQKEGEAWRQAGSKESADFVRLMLVDFEFAKAEEILSRELLAPAIKGEPTHVLKIYGADDKATRIALWKNDALPKFVYLTRDEEGYFLANAQLLDHFSAQEKPLEIEKARVGGGG